MGKRILKSIKKEKRNQKLGFLSFIVLITAFSFVKEDKNSVVGIWSIELHQINDDTVFNLKDENSTLKYFYKIKNIDTLTIKNKSYTSSFKETFNDFLLHRIKITTNYMLFYKIDSKGKKSKYRTKLAYQINGNQVELNDEDNPKSNFKIEFNKTKDKLIFKQTEGNINVVTTYFKAKK
ncbi:MAG: hypothetical protein FGM14_08885 [Flavobacteriales bacterium]|nr:hypothetical protein [Flavobacteriales bacterium]